MDKELLGLKGFIPKWGLHIKSDLSALKFARLLCIPVVEGALSSTDAHVILLQRSPRGPGHPDWYVNPSESQLSEHPFFRYLGHQQMCYWTGFVPLRIFSHCNSEARKHQLGTRCAFSPPSLVHQLIRLHGIPVQSILAAEFHVCNSTWEEGGLVYDHWVLAE